MFTQPKDYFDKTKPAFKTFCSSCHRTNHSISACFKKYRDHDNEREAYAISKSPQKSFVQTLMIEQQEMIIDQMNITIDNAVEVHHETLQKITPHRTTIVLHHDRNHYDRNSTPRSYTRSRYDNYQLDPIVLLIDHTDHLTDAILVLDTDQVLFRETTILLNLLLHLDLLF